jgi:DNA polymerase III subunit chi
MSRIDFYVLSESAPDAMWRCACRLIEKAVDLDQRVYVQTSNAADSQRVDELLWTFSDRAFMAHQIWDGTEVPHALVKVLIGECAAPATHRQLLVNFSNAIPDQIDSYSRIVEIVDTDAERKRLSRERYKQYRERGCALETHNV